MTENVLKKLIKIGEEIIDEKKSMNFFGIFERTDISNAWDIIVSASWLSDKNKNKDLVYIISKIRRDFDTENLRLFSKVVLLNNENLLIKEFNKRILHPISDNPMELINFGSAEGTLVKRSFVFVSEKNKFM